MIELVFDPCPSAWRKRPKKDGRSRCMGRSRGGLTTKIHALVDAEGLPIALKLSEGQAHDGRSAREMLDKLGEGQILLADRAYDATNCASASSNAALGATSSRCRTARTSRHSAHASIASETASNASSTNSNTSAQSPHDTTNATTTSLQASNSHLFEFGADLIESRPKALRAFAARKRPGQCGSDGRLDRDVSR